MAVADDEDGDWFEDAFDDEPDAANAAEEDATDADESDADENDTETNANDEETTDSIADDSVPDDSVPDDPSPSEQSVDTAENDTDDPFGDAFDGDSHQPAASGAADSSGQDDLFDDDFANAFGGAPSPGGDGEDFGFDVDGDVGAGAPGGFDTDEEYESDIPRIDLGIDGLDDMIQGGVPERSLIVAVGGAGTGKTTFGLQFLNEAIQNGDRAVFITLEESRERVLESAADKGWSFQTHEEEGRLAIIDIDPVEMANSLTSIRNELPRLVEEFGATRLVLDSVSLLEMMYDEQSTRRTEIYDFTKALKDAGVTTMLTSEASEDNEFASRHGIIEYLTDAVVVLRYIRPDDFRETRLAVEIQKIRDANHSRETKPYEITHQGISVYRQANIF
nr:KaiC domain-containing protein [Halobacterium zhouii]